MPDKNPQNLREDEAQLITLFNQGCFAEVEARARAMTRRFPDYGFGWNALAAVLNKGGRNQDALAPAQKAAGLLPNFPEVHSNLGVILQDLGRLEEAAASYRRAVEIKPDYAEAHNNLGGILQDLGRLKEAEACFRRAVEIRPDYAEAHSNLGSALKGFGRLKEAETSCRRALEIRPDFAEAHNNLGGTLLDLGRLKEAEASCRRALEIRPDYPQPLVNLGGILRRLGRLGEAETNCRRAVEIRPDFAEAHNNLGGILHDLGRLEEAEASYRRAFEIKPDYAEAHSNLGNLLRELGHLRKAELSCQRAIQIKPDFPDAHSNLGSTLRELGRLKEAEVSFRRALELKPIFPEAQNNLGGTLGEMGRQDEAEGSYRRALETKPEYAAAHSNLLLSLNSLPHAPAEVYAEHRRWDEQQTKGCAAVAVSVTDRNPLRRLRVGYMSPDLRQHSVAYFFEPLLRAHDRTAVEISCYAEVLRPDAVTARLQGLADHWVSTVGLSDQALAQRIADDQIDILVDLAGHTANNRLLIFARRPAPVQVNWLGYPNTTGLRAMDYRLVDEITDPTGTADALATERLVRLDGGFLCYAAPAEAPPPVPPSSLTSGHITFGSFNNPTKLSPITLDTWAAILKRVPGSHLLLKGKLFNEASGRTAFLGRLKALGVDAGCVTLLGRTHGLENHLADYGQVDIALDPFPYNGTTTTCEALWMGVAVVTLCGDRHAGRVGASLLTRVGLTELIADSVQAYVELAAALAQDRQRLGSLRRTLRERMITSPLCDAPAFARQIEATYRQIWRTYCEDTHRVLTSGRAEPARSEEDQLVALFNQGSYAEAENLARTLTQRFPDHGFGWNALGAVLGKCRRFQDALEPAQRAAFLLPGVAEAHSNLGANLRQLGRLEESEASCRRALEINPDSPEAHSNLGNTLRDLDRLEEAETSLRRALQISPNYAEAHNNLATVLIQRGRLSEAEVTLRRALELNLRFPEALDNLGRTLNELGRQTEAEASYRRALQINPGHAATHSDLLLCLNSLPHGSAEIYAEHRRWDEQQTKGCLGVGISVTDRNPLRRLRVGYMSPDLRQHSVAYFFEPLLRAHDRTAVEISCYAEVLRPDAVTARLQGLADHWVSTVGLSDQALAQRIADDQIDILVDLAGHTANNRLLIFARRPAPVQVNWLGYPNTTGLRAMDYRLVDEITDPTGTADALATERLVRLDGGFLCYAAPAEAPPPVPPSSLTSGHITFGSFNNPTKLSPITLDTWAAILKRVPGSHLLLKGKLFNEASGRTAFLGRLKALGVDAGCVTLLGRTHGLENHLADYGQVDIALDPFPYNGTTTTCEALWMGVAVVTLCGDRHAGRVGASLLTRVGLTELIADSVQAYVELAAALAQDRQRLGSLRRTLRERMITSPLCDAPAFARQIEATYRRIWRTFYDGSL